MVYRNRAHAESVSREIEANDLDEQEEAEGREARSR